MLVLMLPFRLVLRRRMLLRMRLRRMRIGMLLRGMRVRVRRRLLFVLLRRNVFTTLRFAARGLGKMLLFRLTVRRSLMRRSVLARSEREPCNTRSDRTANGKINERGSG
ncbi:MAG: hypothetical protein WCA85_21070 [Paraburkholderia sp.]|uniref:hypothetical protein n=1 Tax=Paraburkholderia sp. TaxID=1926495 RepID=UPI003C6A6F5D